MNLAEKLEISKCLTLSTAHIKDETKAYIEKEIANPSQGTMIAYEKESYGYFIYIMQDEPLDTLPIDLQQVIELARENDCEIICLDAAGPVYSCLPTY